MYNVQLAAFRFAKAEDAIVALETAPPEMRDYAAALLSLAYTRVCRYEDAIAQLELVREQGQQDWRWHYHMGCVAFSLCRYDESAACFAHVLALAEDEPLRQRMREYIDFCQVKKNRFAETEARRAGPRKKRGIFERLLEKFLYGKPFFKS